MEDDLKKNEWKTTSILRQSYRDYLTTKTSKTNGFDTIEIGLVKRLFLEEQNRGKKCMSNFFKISTDLGKLIILTNFSSSRYHPFMASGLLFPDQPQFCVYD